MVLVGNEGEEEEVADEGRAGPNSGEQEQRTRAIVSSETASILSGLGKGPLDVRLDQNKARGQNVTWRNY